MINHNENEDRNEKMITQIRPKYNLTKTWLRIYYDKRCVQ